MTKQSRSYDFPADTHILEQLGEIVTDLSRDAGFDDAAVGDIQLAMDEACTNTIIHGLNKDSSTYFHLDIYWTIGEIEFVITERGAAFDPSAIEHPTLDGDLEDRKIGGLGFYFMQELMDVVEFTTSEDGVKTLRMIKRRK